MPIWGTDDIQTGLFDGNRGVWEVFSSASDARQWHLFSQDPLGQTIE